MCIHPFDLVCVYVWSVHLNSRWKVDDDRVLLGSAPGFLNCSTDIKSKIQLCAGKALWRILQTDLGITFCCVSLYHLGTYNSDILDLIHIFVENNISLKSRCGIVNMYNGFLDALQCLKSSLDQMLTALY